ncbi:maleylpyruvate isomerase family mycothiol-dependent enzyme [Streptomyces kanamyceticus]|uniref:Maleylpyruvate isomerase family mycothiol-dependent enzyme n=2 Tax=Streptomyces kanamyceticus TaxID=1967 RepID=A0A5J6GBB8_STRKN|nr:maleylpyruvate isomerase family mycothiol-dependent enzyme [Streptomyces kanamyceticus]QEU91275.1 maleylpyruvate isomerase family mycothiol-dependent enzyme [Streptomyces kanamyceticus]
MSPDAHRTAIAEESAKFAEAIKGADLATPVPGCPGWTLLDLVRHAGSVQRWFAVLLRQSVQEPPRSRDVDLRLPASDDGWPDWLLEGAAEAADVFGAMDPDAPMWTWGADGHARFWVRRMLFETLVHRVDAEAALGLPSTIDPALAADGVDEFLVNLPFATPFAPGVARLRGTGETIRFHRTDAPGDWLVRLAPDGFRAVRDDVRADVTPTATVGGPAAELLLLLYGRTDRAAAAFEVAGDEALLARWFDNSRF